MSHLEGSVHFASLEQIHKDWHGTVKSYIIGLIAALILTAASFLLVIANVLATKTLIYCLIALALIQAVVQLVFFLHVGQEVKPHWKTLMFYIMVIVLLIIAAGSLWIMYDLNDRVMSHMNGEMAHD